MTRRTYLPVCAAALAPLLLTSAMVAQADTSYPTKGMSTGAVERTFGHPKFKSAPSGLPPITHWVYDNFTVYFDRNRVIFHIKNTATPASATTAAKVSTAKGDKKHRPLHAPAKTAPLAEAAPVAGAATAPAVVAAAPASAAPAAAASQPSGLAALEASEQAREAAQHSTSTPSTSQKPADSKPRSVASTVSNQPTVKAVTPMQVMRAGLMRVFQADKVWYVGGAGGISNYSSLATAECNDALVHSGFAQGSCGKATGNTAFKLYAGYNLSPLFAVEGGIAQIGSSSYSTTVYQQDSLLLKPNQVTIGGKITSRVVDANMVVNFHPATRLTVGVKLGAYIAYNGMTSSATGNGLNQRDNLSHSYTNGSPLIGMDVRYTLVGGLAARFDWDRYRNLGEANQPSSRDVDALLAGLNYTF